MSQAVRITPSETPPQVIWYGERGIVNAVITHMTRTSRADSLVKELLSQVLWGHGVPPDWIQDIRDVTFVVEVGLADFGDPDLLIVCRTSTGTKLVFLEAKVVSYADSMQSTLKSPDTRWGMAQPGFNSSINGQLTLKYRFAKALSQWDGKTERIIESRAVFEKYRDRLNDTPSKSPGRALAKPSILEGIFSRLKLAEIPEQNCYYVALTWDTAAHAFFRSAEIQRKCLPLFLNDEGVDLFDESLDRVGWIGYSELERALDLGQSTEYAVAFRTMQDATQPDASYYLERNHGGWNSFPAHIVSLADSIVGSLESRAQRMEGSYSVCDENKQTIAKIIPKPNSVFVGIRLGYLPDSTVDSWRATGVNAVHRKVQNVTFVGTDVTKLEDASEFICLLKGHVNMDVPPAEETMGA